MKIGDLTLNLEEFIQSKVEAKILEGVPYFYGSIKNEDNVVVATYNWKGEINTDGIIEYKLTINDEL